MTDSFTFRWNAQVFSGWGYVTAWHNFHGSSGFGQAFADSINPDWATKPYEDTIAAAKWLAAQPWADAEPDGRGRRELRRLPRDPAPRPRPTPSRRSWPTPRSTTSTAWWARTAEPSKPRFGGYWEKEQDPLYKKMSPHFGAPRFKTPTLVIHGALDYRVPDGNGLEVFNMLQQRGVRSRLVYYPNENHWILKPQNSHLLVPDEAGAGCRSSIGEGPERRRREVRSERRERRERQSGSRAVTEGQNRAPNRSMLRALGFKDEDFAKPIIGVANGQSTITPCNLGDRRPGPARRRPRSGRRGECPRPSARSR